MAPLPPIPDAFTVKKSAILGSLSIPESSYTDLSPKGTVDEAIKDLIDRINTLEGVVTTSSCSGRVSVFLEGRKHCVRRSSGEDNVAIGRAGGGQAVVPGGKGMGGRWLLISHEPISESDGVSCRTLGLQPMRGLSGNIDDKEPNQLRIARFQFEPMILHIMTASLHHAQPILAAAINAGFRESGVQSLKNLDDVNCFPMVAIRSAGLALESVVGVCLDHDQDKVHSENEENEENDCEKQGIARSMVSDQYCRMLLKLANERFKINSERMKRFEDGLFRQPTETAPDWEDSEARKARKRAEGLEKREVLRRQGVERCTPEQNDQGIGIF